jgi:hypothetical protein
MTAQVQAKSAPTLSFTPVRTNLLQSRCACGGTPGPDGECAECRQKRLQRRSSGQSEPSTVPPIVHNVLRTPGQPLDRPGRAFIGSRFSYDFGRVQVHATDAARDAWSKSRPTSSFTMPATLFERLPAALQPAARETRLHNDDLAHQAAHTFDLEAFTVGKDVYFGRGRWQPETGSGLALLRHELGHISRGEGRAGTVEGWSTQGHRTITLQALADDTRFSPSAQLLLANTAPIPDFNRPQIAQDMVSFWSGEALWRAPLGLVGGAILGGITPPEQGTQIGGVRVGGVLPQAILGTGLIPTVPAEERVRGREGRERKELQRTRVTQELANHGEDLPERNEARMNQYVDQGVATANRCDLYNGLVQLGYALHVAQDRGSHGDGYTADYVQNRPHSEIDDMSSNPAGLSAALGNSRAAIHRFYDGLLELKRQSLANSPLLGQPVPIRPPLVETLLAPPASASPVAPDERGRAGSGGINILSVEF